MNEFDIRQECIARTKFYIDLANKKLNLNMEYPKIVFRIQGTTAGRAWHDRNLIEFNPVILATNIEEFLGRTPGHEVGHLAAHTKYRIPIKPHGREWQSCMWTLGLPAIRCHNYDISAITGAPCARKEVKPIRDGDMTITSLRGAKLIEFD